MFYLMQQNSTAFLSDTQELVPIPTQTSDFTVSSKNNFFMAPLYLLQ